MGPRFIPDCICIVNENDPDPVMPGFDPWVTLAAMAMRTERVLLGTMLRLYHAVVPGNWHAKLQRSINSPMDA